MLSVTSLTMSSSALVGIRIAPDPTLATLPLGLTYLALMLNMLPGSLLMQRFGRRAGFSVGAVSGVAAGGLAAYGIYHNHFVLFCIASVFLGIAMSFAQFYRFAATEVVAAKDKSRAISWVLAGGLVAAFIGPGIARYTRDLWSDAAFAASFSTIVPLCLGVLLIQFFLRIPAAGSTAADSRKRPLSVVFMQPVTLVATLCAMIGYGTMNLLMVATPLAMHAHGMAFGHTASVIQWHIVGMFAPSFFTGSLIHRFGVLTVMFCGAVALLLCALVSLYGTGFGYFLCGLILLGIGWNFLFIGATTLLTEAYLPAEKNWVQGINDFMVFAAVAITALTSGYLHHVLGWQRLNQVAIPAILLAAILILLLGLHNKKIQRAALEPQPAG